MSRDPSNPASDLRGTERLIVDAIIGVTDLVESVHRTITTFGGLMAGSRTDKMDGIPGFVYDNIRTITGLVGTGLDTALARLAETLEARESSETRDLVVGALNGVLGDYLAATDNPLAIPMQFRHDGRRVDGVDATLRRAVREAGGRVVLIIHGSSCTELQFQRGNHAHGADLARDLGYLPLYLRYNSGRHISENGSDLADRLEALLAELPGPIALTIVGHSMGGLLARSAYHYGERRGDDWTNTLEAMVFLGTPHHGAPLERFGNQFHNLLEATPYTAPFARLGAIRSAGVTDLRYGNLLHEDWDDGNRFECNGDCRRPVPLPDGVACYAVAATTRATTDDLADRFHWDGLVPVDSAFGWHDEPDFDLAIPTDHQWVGADMSHMDLLDDLEVYDVIRRWLERG